MRIRAVGDWDSKRTDPQNQVSTSFPTGDSWTALSMSFHLKYALPWKVIMNKKTNYNAQLKLFKSAWLQRQLPMYNLIPHPKEVCRLSPNSGHLPKSKHIDFDFLLVSHTIHTNMMYFEIKNEIEKWDIQSNKVSGHKSSPLVK